MRSAEGIGDAYYAPPGHTPVLYAGTEIVEFSPTEELRQMMDVVTKNMEGALTDGTTNTVYRLAGATWFGGSFDSAVNFVTTDTAFFNTLGPSGGPVAKVAAVEHASSGGANWSFNFGQCSAPSD